jgi:phosphoglycolate phosphatase
MNKGLIVFDLDGTLLDSSGDISDAANRTLESFGMAPMDKAAIKDNIGWGVNMLLKKLIPGIKDKDLDSARERFLEFYEERLVEETGLYPGVAETLSRLEEKGKKLAILTNKPEALSRRIIKEFSLDNLFTNITGGDTFSVRKPHPLPLTRIMEGAGMAPSATAFVGDSPIDCETGCAAGVFTVGVSYGFRPVAELKESGCDMIISKFTMLEEVFS